jgi:hypothetical protein
VYIPKNNKQQEQQKMSSIPFSFILILLLLLCQHLQLISSSPVLPSSIPPTDCDSPLIWYDNKPCSPTCDNRTPVCAAVIQSGCACPPTKPVMLSTSIMGECGTFDDCSTVTSPEDVQNRIDCSTFSNRTSCKANTDQCMWFRKQHVCRNRKNVPN